MGMTAADVKMAIVRFHDHLSRFRVAIDELDLHPVPGGGTGTNMFLTLESVVQNLDGAASMAQVCEAISSGSLKGARGSSGVILSQILRGLAETFRDADSIDCKRFLAALEHSTEAAYRVVNHPVDGTILTILREVSEAAGETHVSAGEDLTQIMEAAYQRSVSALEQAGVVDAGGAGLLLMMLAFFEVVSGTEVSFPGHVLNPPPGDSVAGADPVARLRYEVMFFLDVSEDLIDDLRTRWETLGDAIVVAGGDGEWNCHIHTDHIGATIEAAIELGRPRGIRVTDLGEHHADKGPHRVFEPTHEALAARIGVVAVAAGSGLVEVFRQLGCQGMVVGDQATNPSTEEMLAAVDGVPAEIVIVLPNHKNLVPLAEHLDTLTTKQVAVVPTRSMQQGVAAMFGYDMGTTDLAGTMEDMAAAASSVIDGEITQAVRDAIVDFGPIRKGEWIGTADGTILVSDVDMEAALRGLVAAMLPPNAELLTLYTGEGASPASTKMLVAWMAELYPYIEVSEVKGRQPLYPYLVTIE